MSATVVVIPLLPAAATWLLPDIDMPVLQMPDNWLLSMPDEWLLPAADMPLLSALPDFDMPLLPALTPDDLRAIEQQIAAWKDTTC